MTGRFEVAVEHRESNIRVSYQCALCLSNSPISDDFGYIQPY